MHRAVAMPQTLLFRQLNRIPPKHARKGSVANDLLYIASILEITSEVYFKPVHSPSKDNS